MDTVGIYVGNNEGRCGDFFIWIRLDHRTLDEMVSLPLLREDPPISETWPLEESASHHIHDMLRS